MKTIRNIWAAFRDRTAMAALLACFAMMWSSAIAATVAMTSNAPSMAIDPLLATLTCFLSTLAGGTTLMIRFNNTMMGEDAAKPITKPWIFAASHMGGSWLAGSVGFIAGQANQWTPWTVLLAVVLMSFAGAKGVEALADKWIGSVKLGGTQ